MHIETGAFEVFSEVNACKRKESCVSEKESAAVKWRSTLIRSLRERVCGKTGLIRCEEIAGLGRAE